MKSNAIIRIVIFSLVILILLGLLGTGLAFGIYKVNFRNSSYTIADGTVSNSGSVDASLVRDLTVEWVSGSVTIVPADTDTITFSETGTGLEEKMMVWKQNGDDLIIQFCEESMDDYISFGITAEYSKDLTIQVPMNWTCKELDIDSVSANVEVSDLTVSELELENVSGSCQFQNCGMDSVSIDTVSGDFRFDGTVGTLECDAVSANCVLVTANAPRSIEIEGVSGNLDLILPESCGFTATLDTMSGNFSSDFSTTSKDGKYVCGDGACYITVSTMSGDITIRKAD